MKLRSKCDPCMPKLVVPHEPAGLIAYGGDGRLGQERLREVGVAARAAPGPVHLRWLGGALFEGPSLGPGVALARNAGMDGVSPPREGAH